MLITKSNSVFSGVSLTSLFDNFLHEPVVRNAGGAFLPAADIGETEKAYEIQMAVPGMKKEDFRINLEENYLTVDGERSFQNSEKGKTWHKVQTHYGAFSRSFYLPDNSDASRIKAAYLDGILTITIPKDEAKALKASILVH